MIVLCNWKKSNFSWSFLVVFLCDVMLTLTKNAYLENESILRYCKYVKICARMKVSNTRLPQGYLKINSWSWVPIIWNDFLRIKLWPLFHQKYLLWNCEGKSCVTHPTTKNLIHKIPSSVAPRRDWRGVGGYFTDRDWNITDQSWPFTRIFNLASNPRTTINVQNHDQSIVNKNNNATKFYQSDEMLRNAQSKIACKKAEP